MADKIAHKADPPHPGRAALAHRNHLAALHQARVPFTWAGRKAPARGRGAQAARLGVCAAPTGEYSALADHNCPAGRPTPCPGAAHGLRDIPRLIPVHRLIWRSWYRSEPGRAADGEAPRPADKTPCGPAAAAPCRPGYPI